ncbi:hypothetical protein VP01_7192g1, partial [Puccinia sorghi]
KTTLRTPESGSEALKEELFIKTPEGSKRTAPYLRLRKSLYGLKQAPANWYDTLTLWFNEIDFVQSTSNPCLYIQKSKKSFIFFHVDDLIVIGDVNTFESKLIEKGLEMAGVQECQPVNTPLSIGIQLTEATNEEKADFSKLKINHRSHTGILNYLACRTQPDLAPAVSILSSFNHAPGINHWHQIIHCWKYLAGTANLKLTLRPDPNDFSDTIQHFTDATWADNLETRLSRSGSICFWKKCPIAWNSKKQHNITLSSTEAKMNALSDGVQENQWIQFMIEELYDKTLNPTQFLVDNK